MKLKGGILLAVGIPIMILLVGSMTLPFYAFGQANPGQVNEHSVIAVLGIAKVQGEDVIVEIFVEVQPGQNANEVARQALQAQNARPFDSASLGSEGFTRLGAFEPWDNLPVTQNYNPGSSDTKPEPSRLNENGETALTDTHITWDGVTTSDFDIDFGVITDRCPSLVDECPGDQVFDTYNDVAWLRLAPNVLGVTWFGTITDEADMVLNVRFKWNDGCEDVRRSFDAQTVFLHENGHVVGLGHSDIKEAVMYPSYQGARCSLDDDDKEGTTYLYDISKTGSVSGTITDGTDPIVGAKVELEGTTLSAITEPDGTYTISDVPDPVTYTITASADGFESETLLRQTVDGAITIDDFELTSSGGGNGGGGLTGILEVDVTTVPQDLVNKDTVHIFITVTQNGVVEGSAVHLTIVTPNPRSDLAGDFTTDANGEVHTHYKVNAKRDGTGTYHVHAEASKDQASGECLEGNPCHADFVVT